MKGLLRRNKLGIILSTIHLLFFLLTISYLNSSHTEQASFIWIIWFPVDLPWSLLYLIGGEEYGQWVETIYRYSPIISEILYTPHLVHGIIGTIWWFFLPKIVHRLL